MFKLFPKAGRGRAGEEDLGEGEGPSGRVREDTEEGFPGGTRLCRQGDDQGRETSSGEAERQEEVPAEDEVRRPVLVQGRLGRFGRRKRGALSSPRRQGGRTEGTRGGCRFAPANDGGRSVSSTALDATESFLSAVAFPGISRYSTFGEF